MILISKYIYIYFFIFFLLFPQTVKKNRLFINSLQRYDPNPDLLVFLLKIRKPHSNSATNQAFLNDLTERSITKNLLDLEIAPGRQKQPRNIYLNGFLLNHILIQSLVSRTFVITIKTDQYSNGKYNKHCFI